MNRKKSEWVGMIAGLLTTGAFAPQVWSVWSQLPTPAVAVSLIAYLMISVGVAMWLAYGISLRDKPLIVYNSITLTLTLSVLAYKVIYG